MPKGTNMTDKNYTLSSKRLQSQPTLSENMLALGFYTILAVIATWPALIHLRDRVLGAYPGDNFQFLWALWYAAHATFDLHSSPFFDPDVYFPFGFSLFRNLGEVSPATILASVPLTRCLGEVATYNLLIMISFALTGFGTFLLARELRAGFPGALIGGIGVGFCAYHFAHAAGHLSLASTQWIPFFFLYLERTLRKPSVRSGVLVGLFYSLSSLVSWYYASLLPIAAALYLSLRLNYFKERTLLVNLIKPALAAAACIVVLVLPFAVPYVLALKHGTMTTRSLEESQEFAASVADFFIPPMQHTFFGRWVAQHWRSGPNGVWTDEWEIYLGTLILPLALVGILHPKHRRITAGLVAMGAGAFVLALGPSLYFVHPASLHGALNLAPLSRISLPVLALKAIPPFSFLRGWARMSFFLQLAASLLAAQGCTYLLELIPRRSVARGAVAFAVISLATVDSMITPFGMASVTPRPVDRWLAAQPGKFPVMEYPIPEHAYSGLAIYSTRFTGQQIIMGYASNPPNASYFETLSTFPSPQALDLLQQWGTKFVLVDESLYQGGSEFWLLWQTWKSLEPAMRESGRLKEVTTLGGVHVYQLQRREIQPVSQELIPNSGFESGTSAEIQGWTRVGHPIIDRSGNEAHGGSGSCSVTASDYLVSNPIPVESGHCYLLQLFSRRAKTQTAFVRLQATWLDALQHPLDPSTASIRVVEVNKQWQSARDEFHAPPESRYATIYAVTQTGAAWLDDFSLREVPSDCEPSLVAIPNPAVRPPGAKKSRSSISWNSHSGAGSYMGLSINGQPETRFAEGPVGMRIFDIETGSRWEFRLYGDTDGTPVKSTIVTSEPIPPLLASPVVFESRSAPGRTTISWNMPGHGEAEVWVSQDGGPEHLFVRGATGSQEASWITRGSTYEFRLYAMIPGRQLIGQLAVRETQPLP
jgi:hypothetical protein